MSNLTITPPVIAHRGASLFAPENTLAAFRKAKAIGVQWVEFDVMLSADNQLVVIHDETLNRTTNGKGLVIEHTYDDLKTLDAGSWFDPEFRDERIPSFAEVLDLLNELGLFANIEIKAQPGKEDLTVKKVLETLELIGTPKNLPLISSFCITTLEIVRKYSSSSLLGFLMHEWNKDWEIICNRLHCVAVDVNQEILSPARVKKIKATNRTLLAYTVNNAKRAQELFAWGVDAVFSDNPVEILSLSKSEPRA